MTDALLLIQLLLLAFLAWELRRLNKRLSKLAILFLAPGSASAFPLPQPAAVRAFDPAAAHPNNAAKEILAFLAGLSPDEAYRYRFFHALDVLPDDLDDETTNFRAHLPMANGYGPTPPRPFPIDKAKRVWALDISTVGWSARAFHEVARLDPTCREPHVRHDLADALRKAIGVELDEKTFHCEAMIPMAWFVRQLEETDLQRVNTDEIVYYNLLYAKERFGLSHYHSAVVREPIKPKPRLWPAGKPWTDGKAYAKPFEYLAEDDQRAYEKALKEYQEDKGAGSDKSSQDGFIDRNFPRDAKDFAKRWGQKATQDFLDAERQFAANGAIISGGFNDPKAGSVVAPNDRAIRFQRTAFGTFMKTNDFTQTSGKGNLINFPFQTAVDDLDEDASESIASKQDGFPSWFINGAKAAGSKRVESGDPHIVFDKINGSFPIVQTYWKCVGCHYPSNVILPPSNHKLLKSYQRRNELHVGGKRGEFQTQVIDQFFWESDAAGEGWGYKMEGWRLPFSRSLAITTRSEKRPKGLTGTEFAALTNSRREAYDAPYTLDRAARELGYPRLAVVGAAAFLASVEGVKLYGDRSFDAATLLLDDSDPGVPQKAFLNDLFIPLAKTLAVARDKESPLPWFLISALGRGVSK